MLQMFHQQVSYATWQSQGAHTAPVTTRRQAAPWGNQTCGQSFMRVCWPLHEPLYTLKGITTYPWHRVQTVAQLGQVAVTKGLLRCKMVLKIGGMNFLSYSGGKTHVNPSAVRKLTDHKDNGVNYTGFFRWALQTACVKLSPDEHHGS